MAGSKKVKIPDSSTSSIAGKAKVFSANKPKSGDDGDVVKEAPKSVRKDTAGDPCSCATPTGGVPPIEGTTIQCDGEGSCIATPPPDYPAFQAFDPNRDPRRWYPERAANLVGLVAADPANIAAVIPQLTGVLSTLLPVISTAINAQQATAFLQAWQGVGAALEQVANSGGSGSGSGIQSPRE